MFDLNGFKGYNDTFGHVAGDALLARLGLSSASELAPYGEAYRLGGDEFCAVLELDAERVEELIAIAAHALSETGEGSAITASYGVVLLPHEADSLEHAVQLADQRHVRAQAQPLLGRPRPGARRAHAHDAGQAPSLDEHSSRRRRTRRRASPAASA